MVAKTQEQTADERRGIRNVQALYKNRTVSGNFDNVSIAGRVGKNIVMGNQSLAAEQAAVAYGGSYVEKRAERFRQNRESQKKKKGLDIQMNYGKKMQGPMFWLVAMIAMIKDVFDLLFTLSVVLSFLSSIFAVIVALTILFYLKYNEVPITTRKAVVTATAFLIEFIPFAALLPMTTANLFLVRIIDNNERLSKLVEKGRFSLASTVSGLSVSPD